MKITLQYLYLKHDIDQWTYRLGNTRIQDDEVKNGAQSTEIDTDVSFYRRKIEDAVAHLSQHLAEDLTNTYEDATDTLNTSKESWVFTFKDDSSITADSQTCANLMHRFVIMHVIRDWASIYAADQTAVAQTMYQEALDALDEGLWTIALPTKHRRVQFIEDSTITITDSVTIGEDA